jgi:flagellar biosynthesis protein FlhG
MMRQDQAHGLRRLFAAPQLRLVPVLSNPHLIHGGVLLEALCAAFAALDLQVLLVDAGERSPEPSPLAALDMSHCIERLSPKVSYLAARGLPMRHLDAKGSAAGFIDALQAAAPQSGVILLHAGAQELARVVPGRAVRPLLLADTDPQSVMHAYSGMKWLTQRAGLLVYSVLMSCPPQSRLGARIAQQLGSCGDTYLGAAVSDWACLDPRLPQTAQLSPELRHLAHELLLAAAPDAAVARPATRARPAAPFAHAH